MSKVVPEGWVQGELAEFCDVVGGGTPDRNNPDFWGGDIPWVSPTEITGNTSKYISQTKEKITEIGLEKSSAKLHPVGTLLMTSRASIGFVAINTIPMATNQGFQSLRCKKKVLVDFLYQYIIWSRPQLERLAAGSTFAEISSANVKRMTVCFPSVEQQQKIATILSSVDNVIEKTRTQIDKLKDLKTGMMQELLTKGIGHTEFKDSVLGRIPRTWKVTTLGAITESSAFGPRFSSSYYSDDGNVGCIRTTDMDDEWCIDYKTVPLALLKESEFREHFLIDGDLLVTRSGTCGVVDVFQGQLVPMVAAAFLIRFRLSDYVNPWFVKYLMASSSTQKNIQLLASGGVQKNLSGSSLKTLQIAMPSRFEQDGIVKIINSINIKIKILRQENSGLEVLKKALVQSLLTGKTQVTFMV